jgi:hypothetical protein
MLNLKKNLIAGLVLSGSVAVSLAAASLAKNGTEYPILPTLALDQVVPHLSLGPGGGYLVCQDTLIDGNGIGIRARRLNADLSAAASTFAVNSITAGDQQNAKVAVLSNGGAVFVWQGSTGRGNKIFARFMGANQQFTGEEIGVADRMFGHQSDAAVAVLTDGTVVVVWGELNRDPSMSGIFGQRFSSAGQRLGATFMVNTVTYLNQRTPAIAALESGGFVVAWVSDEFRQRSSEYIDIAARLFNAQGEPIGSDFALNSTADICANPAVVAISGGFRAAWSSRSLPERNIIRQQTVPLAPDLVSTQLVTQVEGASPNRWDVSTRAFNLQGAPLISETVVNQARVGDQYSPRLVSFQGGELVLWTSWGQDGSYQGIIGRVVRGTDQFDGDEFIVNTRRALSQIYPTGGAIGERVLIAWASFISASQGLDIVAQQFMVAPDEALSKPAIPFAFAVGQNSISVSWAEVGAQAVGAYRVHVDNESAPIESTEAALNITRPEWAAASVHTVRVSYRLNDGRVSPLSDPVSLRTWGADENGDSLPDDWQQENWGKQANWPAALADSDGDGATNLAEFLAGTDPSNAGSVLKLEVSPRQQGLYLQWPTTPGGHYQIQYTSDFNGWTNVGGARFAPSSSDAVPLAGSGQVQYYRVIRMR